MVVKAETPITREKSSNKKKKNRKNKDEAQSEKPKKSNEPSFIPYYLRRSSGTGTNVPYFFLSFGSCFSCCLVLLFFCDK